MLVDDSYTTLTPDENDDCACYSEDESSISDYSSSAAERRSASMTSVEDNAVAIDDSRPSSRIPPQPTSVKINVEGAFIVDEEDDSNGINGHATNDHVHWDRKDIVLPHHTDVVSHVAVDVSSSLIIARLITD